jgi:hypothetical protein
VGSWEVKEEDEVEDERKETGWVVSSGLVVMVVRVRKDKRDGWDG